MAAVVGLLRRRFVFFPLVALAFIFMLVAYGLGFWRRLAQRPMSGAYWGY